MQKIVVHKYGGNSLASMEHFLAVAKFIQEELQANPTMKIIAVVSAMKGETDKLLNDFDKLIGNVPRQGSVLRELGMLGSLGEDKSATYLASALLGEGVEAISLNSFQAGIISTNERDKAKIISINKERLNKELSTHRVLVVTGFQGVPKDAPDEIALLDRGGTDIVAVAMAHCFNTECIFFKKGAGGVQAIDPEYIPNAPVIKRMIYQACIAMNTYGYAYLHPRAVKLAQRFGIGLEFRATPGYEGHDPHAKGTIIDWGEEETIEYINDNFAALIVKAGYHVVYANGAPNVPGMASRFYRSLKILEYLDSTQNGLGTRSAMVALLAPTKEVEKLTQVQENLRDEFGQDLDVGLIPVTIVTYFDFDVSAESTYFEQISAMTQELGINIEYMYSSEHMIHVCVDPKHVRKLVECLAVKLQLMP